MATIKIEHVTKRFGDNTVVCDFSAEIQDGSFVTFLGPSGCGKTTLLRMVAGLERPDEGRIYIDDTIVSSDDVFISSENRGIGMVFQSYALWPHMSVFDNVSYPLKLRKLPKDIIRDRTARMLEIVHMADYGDRMPSELSGGQQQRVALGRALAAQPKVLLLDEPLSNLDARLREDMRYEIKDIQQKLNITVIYVTHDQGEAMTMSDMIYVINEGIIEQFGTPEQIYRDPCQGFAEEFLGKVNFLSARVDNGKLRFEDRKQFIEFGGTLSGQVEVAVRPDDIYTISEDGRFLYHRDRMGITVDN